ncbi:expressed unknown protein [Seminavis robusta]|uniref:Uncharacterized protein n=1 Tax=Seminavis robusta TaxID=568900 RepID=A0A9N8ETY9_9STRA|nr:expressed unknown protein [Seminavis robusta]|eukprot:Sro2152_g316760.1 n/a (181) ;mRNA; r:9913-10455
MNFKILAFSAAALIGMVSAQPEFPQCTIGTDTNACSTPFGEDGFFVCRVQDAASSLRPTLAPGMAGMGRGRRGRGPRGLSRSKCVPLNPPEFDGPGDNGHIDFPRVECGCCDDVCPTPVECGCPCDIELPYGASMKGSKATITKPDGTQINKCVPPAYADADKVTCITECPAEVETRFPL